MHANASTIGARSFHQKNLNDWRESPDVIKCREDYINRISNTIVRIRSLEPPPHIPELVESCLFKDAASKEEYMNPETLRQRVEALLERICMPGNFFLSRGGSSLYEMHIMNIENRRKSMDFMMPPLVTLETLEGSTHFKQTNERHANDVSFDSIEAMLHPAKRQKKEPIEKDVVSLLDTLTRDQLNEHIMSLRKQFDQSTLEKETRIAANTCRLCTQEKLFLTPTPIYCLLCYKRIKQNANYFYRNDEEESYVCSTCFKKSKDGSIKVNERSVLTSLFERKKNDEENEEPWVECDKCKSWQHQICGLYNSNIDLDNSAEYICPLCRIEEIDNGMHDPLPKTAVFGAKDLPTTTVSDHIEKRLCNRLREVDWAKVERNENLDEVLATESLTVREVLSVDKKLNVSKQFMDILPEKEIYPAEFPYRSRVILLFQKIEGVDVCIFVMYVQEFGSECDSPSQRCVYISYLDSVKYFRPQRKFIGGEALRTFVYHEILIGYLNFCKKQGFTTCHIWSCPPKGDDYILYCHPKTQKIPKNDQLRHWYLSMLKKAAKENIVVGLTNMYDQFFVTTGCRDSKVTASRLPYFDGDYWTGRAMDLAWNIEKESGGDYEKILKKLVTKRGLKAMGHTNPSKSNAKDILVMHKLGESILPSKEDFIVVHLQHSCMHCREVIMSGKRWYCTECNKFQECERCHAADFHISESDEVHTLCQVPVDILSNTEENDYTIDNKLFEDRNNFLSFCMKNQLQFDALRRANYSSMMVLDHLKNTSVCYSPRIEWRQSSEVTNCRQEYRDIISRFFGRRDGDKLIGLSPRSSDVSELLELLLFRNSTSKDEYMNSETLMQRVYDILNLDDINLTKIL